MSDGRRKHECCPQVKTYAEIVDEVGGPDGDITSDGYGFNGPTTVASKVAWARKQGLGGVMFWEMGQDKLGHPASLLAAAAASTGLPKPAPPRSAKTEL